MDTTIMLEFPGASVAEANQLALDLQDHLIANATSEVEVVKESNDTMDFGATLAIILGASSTIAIAKGIANWLMKQQDRKVTIKSATGEIIGENLSSKDIAIIFDKVKQI